MAARFNLSAVFILSLLALTTDAAVAQQSAEPDADEQRIRELDRRWVEAVQAGDFETAGSMYAEDGLIMPPNAVQGEGTGAAAQFWKAVTELPNVAMDFGPTEIEVAEAGDMAYEIGTYTLSFDGEQGRVEDRGKYVVVWTKEDGEWKVAADIFNSDVPAR